MNKIWFRVFLSFFFLLTFCSNTNAKTLQALEPLTKSRSFIYDNLITRNTLTVAMYKGNTPPFYFTEENKRLSGIDVEIITGFAQELGLEIKFIRTNSLDGVIHKVMAGEADLAICKLSMTFQRATKVLFSKPYIKLRKGLLVNRVLLEKQLNNRSKEETIQNLQGTLGVIGNSSYVAFAQQRFKHMEVVEYPSWQAVVNDVLSQKIIAGFRDEAEIKKVILDDKDYAMKLLTVVLEDDYDPKGIAVPQHAVHLKLLLDFYIDSLGLQLTANSVLFEYQNVIEHLNRYRNKN